MASLVRSSSTEATLCLLLLLLMRVISSTNVRTKNDIDPKPKTWPKQFHSVLVIKNPKTEEMQVVDLWYDWSNGRNLNLIQHQLGKLLYDVEWNNGTSYYYTLNESDSECRTVVFEVGILRPNWLEGATYLGQRYIDGFLCNFWSKVDFIWYYEDVVTRRPVHWVFYTGRAVHVMTFEVGAVLEDSKWQAPVYCFNKEEEEKGEEHQTTRFRSRSLQHPYQLPSDSISLPRLYDSFSVTAS